MLRIVASALGLIALVAAIVVGSLAALGFLSDAPTSSQVGGSEADATEEAPRTESRVLDESVRAGRLEWTVREVSRTGRLRAYTMPPTTLHGDFVVVTFAVRNASDGPITLTDESIALVDEDGLTGHPAPVVNSEYVPPEKAILFNERGLLDPGERAEGRVNFDLGIPFGIEPSANLSGLRLELGDADPTVEEEKAMELPF